MSELRVRSQQLEDENGMLSEKNVQNIADMENLQQQLAELIKENERRDAFPVEDKHKVNSTLWPTDGRHGVIVVIAGS